MDVDKSMHQKVVGYLKRLGLSPEQADTYIFLLSTGPSTVLSISRGLKTGRTKLYPLLEELAEKQLITIHERHYGTSYEAQPPHVIEFLVTEHQRRAEALRSDLPAITNILEQLQLHSPHVSRITEYRGLDGLKQMNFNLTKAGKEYRVFELASLDKLLGKHFAETMRSRTTALGTKTFDLTNDPQRAQSSGLESGGQARYIDAKIFKIQFETFIYNNCVALLNYDRDDIFGVEIYNDKLATQQKQIFDLLWSQATPL